jgi:hypothetical protein
MMKRRSETRKRQKLIERARTEHGIFAKGMGGYTNTDNVVLDTETFKKILDMLSHLEKEGDK